MRVPFDATVLQAVVVELGKFTSAKVQRIVQPDELTVCVELYGGPVNGVASLLICAHAEHYRMHFVTRRYGAGGNEPPALCAALRSRIEGATLDGVEQPNGDRLVRLAFSNGHELVVELMGKHSNAVLVDEHHRAVAAFKWVGRSKSSRPIQPGQPYVLPPVLATGATLSPFAQKLVAAGGTVDGPVHPVLCPGSGAYPYSVAPLGIPEYPRPTISIALEQHYDAAIPAALADAVRSTLVAELSRVLRARDQAIQDLSGAVETGLKAGELQRMGELILAYGPTVAWPRSSLDAWDYEGNSITIPTQPDLGFKENAERFFSKARRAKDRLEFARSQLQRMQADRQAIQSTLASVTAAERLSDVIKAREVAASHRWLHTQHHAEKAKDRPFEGHRVRETLGPGGVRVLYGENADANDYLTLRVAKPNDIWLHIRGGTSAHVVIATGNQPDRIGPEALRFAAELAVKNSPSKHAGIVAVDYTLKKYVRKAKGAPSGTAFYTHEKTLHVSS